MAHVLYLTFDLNDAATWRRVAMLHIGGADVTLAGFHRGPPPAGDGQTRIIPLGQTYNARMGQRALAVARAFAGLRGTLGDVPAPDVILARNLETLALAPRLRRLFGSRRPALVYECLDIHAMMLGEGPKARALRQVERSLLAHTRLILTSSPAFVRHYFTPLSRTRTPIRIVENKVLPGAWPRYDPPAPGPIRIGWFGILRCAASLACLDAATRAAPGRYRIILRGKPALDAVPDFHQVVAANPDMVFEGPYDGARDLPHIYGDVHFSWAIDRYEANQNSDWLLPNRLYEGSAFGAVPITLTGTETAAHLARLGAGLQVADVTPQAFDAVMGHLTPADWAKARTDLLALPRTTWTFTEEDCVNLVAQITRGARIGTAQQPAATKQAALP